MSGFFGFDTSMPKFDDEKKRSVKGKGSGKNMGQRANGPKKAGKITPKTHGPTNTEDVDQVLEERFKVRGGLEEEGSMTFDNFKRFEDEADELNDETFGAIDDNVEFEFAKQESHKQDQTKHVETKNALTIEDIEKQLLEQSLSKPHPTAAHTMAVKEVPSFAKFKPPVDFASAAAIEPLNSLPLNATDINLMLKQGINPVISLAAFYHNNPTLAPPREVQQHQIMVLQHYLQTLAASAPRPVPVPAAPPKEENLEQRLAQFRKLHKISPPLAYLHDDRNGPADVAGNKRKDRVVWMTRNEKQVVGKIQISQLLDKTSWADDFYYQMFRTEHPEATESEKESKAAPKPGQKLGKAGKWLNQRMQNQMQSIIERHKQRQSNTNIVMLQGALGKISSNNFQKPREALQLHQSTDIGASSDVGDAADPTSGPSIGNSLAQNSKNSGNKLHSGTALVHRSVLGEIEALYNKVIELEKATADGNNTAVELLKTQVWELLHLSDAVPLDQPHVFMQILSYSKGKKLMPRLTPYFEPQQVLTFVDVLLTRLNDADACSLEKKAPRETVDLFMTFVIPAVVTFVSTAALPVVSACLRVLMIRHSMLWLAGSKVGLAILTMLLSRAEIVKQGAQSDSDSSGAVPPSERELQTWSMLYGQLFQMLKGRLSDIFGVSRDKKAPVLYTDAQGRSFTSSLEPEDDMYVWQFLAAMSVSASSIDQQRTLVTEVREQVLEAVRDAKANTDDDSLESVNLFLHALGLDASQLS